MKCEGAETLLRAIIDNDEGVAGAMRRERWLAGQDITYLQDLADAAQVFSTVVSRVTVAKLEAAHA